MIFNIQKEMQTEQIQHDHEISPSPKAIKTLLGNSHARILVASTVAQRQHGATITVEHTPMLICELQLLLLKYSA